MAGLKNIIAMILFMAFFSSLIGCNSTSGVVEPVGVGESGITASALISDGGNTNTVAIDVIRDACDDENPDELDEPFTPAVANVTFVSGSLAPSVSIKEYSVNFVPQPSADGSGGTYLPPDLATISFETDFTVPTNSTTTVTVIIMPFSSKNEFLVSTDPVYDSSYTFRIKFKGDDEWGNSFSITVDTDALLYDVDNC